MFERLRGWDFSRGNFPLREGMRALSRAHIYIYIYRWAIRLKKLISFATRRIIIIRRGDFEGTFVEQTRGKNWSISERSGISVIIECT